MPATLLSVAGISSENPMMGYDLTQNVEPNRAIMQYDSTQAVLKENDDVIVMRPNTQIEGFTYDKANEKLIPKAVNEEEKKDALAQALLPSYLYKHQLYRLPKEEKKEAGK